MEKWLLCAAFLFLIVVTGKCGDPSCQNVNSMKGNRGSSAVVLSASLNDPFFPNQFCTNIRELNSNYNGHMGPNQFSNLGKNPFFMFASQIPSKAYQVDCISISFALLSLITFFHRNSL